MNNELSRALRVLVLLVGVVAGGAIPGAAQVVNSLAPADGASTERPPREDGWIIQRDEQTGVALRTMELTLHPQGPPQPVLQHRLIPDAYDRTDGNAALFYLKALGFFEQEPARQQLSKIRQQAAEQARELGKEYGDMPPYVWLRTPPDQLPLEAVRDHLRILSFQRPIVREAAQRDRFDMDRNLREVADPMSYLLAEIQSMRELARTQSLRCRLAIAEGRVDDAIEITGQQFALARHLGQDEFLVSNLVGMAVASIAWNDALYLVQHADAPNLYWALTAMPTPLVDIRPAMAFERQFLYEQLKALREVDERPRPAGYWQDFLDQLLPQFGYSARDLGLPPDDEDPQTARAVLVGYIALAYPGAKDYLITECGMPAERVASYPTAQVVFLAAVRFYERWRDEHFKWTYLPYWQAREHIESGRVEAGMRDETERYGWCTAPANILLPAVTGVFAAQARSEQQVALLQSVEAVRLYSAAHDGQLPRTLEELPVPVPIEPFTGKPIEYQHLGNRAILLGSELPGRRYRLILRIADQQKGDE